jgi:arylsulfatase A-like enzyme
MVPNILVALLIGLVAASHAAERPNILVIVADDLGWADVGYHGSAIPTPNIDRLCREGVELNHHYVSPVCTPTRIGLLTGRYWSRFGNTNPNNERCLPWGTETIASALRRVGYDTCMTGKWHLGSKSEWGPRQFGFDQTHGSLAGGVNPLNHLYKHGVYSKTWHRNDRLIEEQGHATDLITREAIRYLRINREQPFFVYVPFTAVHTPFLEAQRYLDACRDVPDDRRFFAACLVHLDEKIGELVSALEETGQGKNTLILFFSDNGGQNPSGDDSSRYPDTKPTSKVKGLNTPLRGWKAGTYEGGIRTPALVNWPGTLKPGKCDALLSVTDWMPTLCALAGKRVAKEWNLDGRDIWPLISDTTRDNPERTLYCKGPNGATRLVIHDGWKLIEINKTKSFELYHLDDDPNEERDLIHSEPDQFAKLKALLDRQRRADDDAKPDPSRRNADPR